jgi:hypothetical protein
MHATTIEYLLEAPVTLDQCGCHRKQRSQRLATWLATLLPSAIVGTLRYRARNGLPKRVGLGLRLDFISRTGCKLPVKISKHVTD